MKTIHESLGEDDVLTKSTFHKLLVGLSLPAGWPDWAVLAAAAALAALAGAVWWLLAADGDLGVAVVAVLLAFFAADAYLLVQLPRQRISFGVWRGQYFPLALPRAAVALVLAPVGLLIGWTPALIVAVALQFVGTAALYRGGFVEPHRLGLSKLAVDSGRATPGTPPVRLLHLSDIHLERLGDREAALLGRIREIRPDVIVITGDYVNTSNNVDPVTHEQVHCLLSKLRAPYGVYAVLGSPPVDLHDTIPPLFEGTGVRLLRNEAVEVMLSRGRRLVLLGVDCHHNIPRDAAVLDGVLAGAPEGGPRVLLYHSPELMPQAAERGIDLYLCGHTHGGQVRLPVIGPLLTMSKLGRRYVMGHYHEGRTHLYVTRGIGFEGLAAPRVRLFCPPEILLVSLT